MRLVFEPELCYGGSCWSACEPSVAVGKLGERPRALRGPASAEAGTPPAARHDEARMLIVDVRSVVSRDRTFLDSSELGYTTLPMRLGNGPRTIAEQRSSQLMSLLSTCGTRGNIMAGRTPRGAIGRHKAHVRSSRSHPPRRDMTYRRARQPVAAPMPPRQTAQVKWKLCLMVLDIHPESLDRGGNPRGVLTSSARKPDQHGVRKATAETESSRAWMPSDSR